MAAVALLAGGCGNDVENGVTGGEQPVETDSLTIYASLPGKGPDKRQSDQLVRGMKLAFAEQKDRIDGKTLNFVRLDDTGPDGKWDPGQVTDNARIAIRNPATVAYIGELDSGASALSIPILNEAGMLQVSPTSGYSGLTRDDGVIQGEPDKYYPSGKRTFGRITPGDRVQAAAQVKLQDQRGCNRVHLLHSEDLYGSGLARLIAGDDEGGKRIAGDDTFDSADEDFASLAREVARTGAPCAFVGTEDPLAAARVVRALHRADGTLKIFVPDRMVTSAFTEAIGGGAAGVTYMTSPRLRRADYPAPARSVLRRYRAEYGESATVDALFGYATMDAVLEAIRSGGGSGSRQAKTIRGFFDLDRDSVLGHYTIDASGDSSLSDYGSYVVRDAQPRFAGVIKTG